MSKQKALSVILRYAKSRRYAKCAKKRIACKNGEKVHQILGVNMQDPSLIFLFATFKR